MLTTVLIILLVFLVLLLFVNFELHTNIYLITAVFASGVFLLTTGMTTQETKTYTGSHEKTFIVRTDDLTTDYIRSELVARGYHEVDTDVKQVDLMICTGKYLYDKSLYHIRAGCKSRLNAWYLVNKAHLHSLLMKNHLDFIPESYVYPDDQLPKLSGVWILRPEEEWSGRGILITDKESELMHYLKTRSPNKKTVITRYITNPALMPDGRKFHIRINGIIYADHHGDRRLALIRQGRIAHTVEPYQQGKYNDAKYHDTHFSKSGVLRFPDDFPAGLPVTAEQVFNEITRQQTEIFKLTAQHVKPYEESKAGFELLGLDYMIDTAGRVILIEVNHKPGFVLPFYTKEYIDEISKTIMKAIVDLVIDNQPSNENYIRLDMQTSSEKTPSSEKKAGSINDHIKLVNPNRLKHFSFLRKLTNDMTVMQYIADGKPWSDDRLNKFFKYCSEEMKQGDERQNYYYVITTDSKPAGLVGIHSSSYTRNELVVTVFISPDFQRRGLARAALIQILTEYQSKHKTPVYIDTMSTNEPMKRLAASLPFNVTESTISIRGKPYARFMVTDPAQVTDKQTPDFPYMNTFNKHDPEWYFTNIRDKSYITLNGDHAVKDPSSYEDADLVTNLFTEYARMKANVSGSISPFDYWQQNYTQIIQKNKTAYDQREYIYHNTKEATTFSPVLSKFVYDLLLKPGSTVLDPFGGWGDRMIGAVCSRSVAKYHAVDANQSLRQGYEQITAAGSKFNSGITLTFDLCPIQTYLSKPNEPVDLIFTSPPYYDYEVYTDREDKDQSIYKTSTYEQWFNEFLKPVLVDLCKLVKPGGFFALHVGNTFSAPTFVQDCSAVLNSHLKHYRTLQCSTGKKRPIPLLVYSP